jgi:5'-hydroxyaverantin dehydrogenase
VTKWDDLVSAFKAAISFSPDKTLDIVIPNAGVASNALIPWRNNAPENEAGDPLQPSQAVVDINFTAVYNTALLAMYMFKKHPSPSPSSTKQIVFVGSMASYQGMTGVPSYGGAKFGVRGIFKAMRELSDDVLGEGRGGVRVNMIAPSWIRSGMTDRIVPYLEKNKVTVGTPEDCTKVVLRMVADEGVKGMFFLLPP